MIFVSDFPSWTNQFIIFSKNVQFTFGFRFIKFQTCILGLGWGEGYKHCKCYDENILCLTSLFKILTPATNSDHVQVNVEISIISSKT